MSKWYTYEGTFRYSVYAENKAEADKSLRTAITESGFQVEDVKGDN